MTSLPELHPQLAEDCIELGQLTLCRLLLVPDANYPWLILVPMRDSIREIHELSEDEQQQLMRESSLISKMLVDDFNADKVNVAALGNVVPQLHIHHIARYHDDAAWPAPVWGFCEALAYQENELAEFIAKVKTKLAGNFQN